MITPSNFSIVCRHFLIKYGSRNTMMKLQWGEGRWRGSLNIFAQIKCLSNIVQLGANPGQIWYKMQNNFCCNTLLLKGMGALLIQNLTLLLTQSGRLLLSWLDPDTSDICEKGVFFCPPVISQRSLSFFCFSKCYPKLKLNYICSSRHNNLGMDRAKELDDENYFLTPCGYCKPWQSTYLNAFQMIIHGL